MMKGSRFGVSGSRWCCMLASPFRTEVYFHFICSPRGGTETGTERDNRKDQRKTENMNRTKLENMVQDPHGFLSSCRSGRCEQCTSEIVLFPYCIVTICLLQVFFCACHSDFKNVFNCCYTQIALREH